MGMVERLTILAVMTKKSHLVFPVAQFNSSQLIPEVSQVNAVFEHCSIDGVAPAVWWTTAAASLQSQTPREWITRGNAVERDQSPRRRAA